ncbi:MAG: GyrI-like small molecule binding domain [Thermoplasmata archaeon]|jgi:effector-binding domain-containing protein|nr:GyrI-like small molecule binding domain [Thermoplasmata archaeon]
MADLGFDLLAQPSVATLPPFRFAHHRVRGPYVPWARVATLDALAEALERAGVDRVGPAFGVYHDMPYSPREATHWTADLGYPIADDATLPPQPALRVRDLPAARVVGLRYRGDLGSFPEALQYLLEWSMTRGIPLEGPLMERFHVSNALTGEEERDVYVALAPLDA